MKGYGTLFVYQKFSMINLFMYDAFLACHSLSQTVMGIILFAFWLIPHEYSLSVFKDCYCTKMQISYLSFVCLFVSYCFDINFDCLFLFFSVLVLTCQLLCSYGQSVNVTFIGMS